MNKDSNSKKCSKGEIMRSGYVTKTGKTIKSKCITAQSNSGEKTSDIINDYVKAKEKMHELARKKFSKESSKKCSKGYIMREGYKVKSHKSHSKDGKEVIIKEHWVKPECVKSELNRSTKGEKLIVIIEKDVLGKYGYKNIKELPEQKRHTYLHRAIIDNKPLSIYRRIIALSTLNRNKDRKLYKILKDDAKWIKTQKEYKQSRSKNLSKTLSKNLSKTLSKILSKKSSKRTSKKSSKKKI